MNKTRWTVGISVAMLVAGAGLSLYFDSDHPASDNLPQKVVDRMEFPKGTGDMVGRADGSICHQVIKRDSAGDHMLFSGDIPLADFRILTSDQKRDIIREHTRKILEREGLMACKPDPFLRFPGLASDATAQPRCLDCGGGCGSASCPAHVVVEGNPCQMQGPDCIISIICCSGSCNCW
jgi:hypothetical protein